MLLRLAGAPARLTEELSADAFLEQARHLHDLTLDSRIADRQRRELVAHASHPLVVERAHHLDRWIRDGEYGKLVGDARSLSRSPTWAGTRGKTVRLSYHGARDMPSS
jgi:hypothetical protein